MDPKHGVFGLFSLLAGQARSVPLTTSSPTGPFLNMSLRRPTTPPRLVPLIAHLITHSETIITTTPSAYPSYTSTPTVNSASRETRLKVPASPHIILSYV